MFISFRRSAASPLKVAALAVLSVVLVSLLASPLLLAQEEDESDNISITLSPQSLDTAINPGQSITNVFRITNGSSQSFDIEPSPKNFVPSGNEGAIQLEDADTPYSLAKWITVSPSGPVTVNPGETADFNATISVPDNADPGGHFGSVVFRTLPTDDPDSAASISQEVAPVILVRVPGDVNEQTSLESFRALNTPVTNIRNIVFETIVKNDGNVHVKPTGTVSIFNTFGQQVSSTPIQSNNVIPGAERKMNAVWDDPGFRFGRYTARLTMVYGTENKLITAETSFIIFPIKQMLPAIVITALLAAGIYRIRRRLLLAVRVLAGKQEGK